MMEIECRGITTREINSRIKVGLAEGATDFRLRHPEARHNFAVGIVQPATVHIEGSAGYYCGGLIAGPEIHVKGSVGWGCGESMMNGLIVVEGSAGNGAGAAMRGGALVVKGDAASRLGVSMKGGTILVTGNCGYMAGFMGQKGQIIVCGDTGEAFADSMYETECFVGGSVAELGNDAVEKPLTEDQMAALDALFRQYLTPRELESIRPVSQFRKIVSGRKLWNFDHRDWKTWQEAL